MDVCKRKLGDAVMTQQSPFLGAYVSVRFVGMTHRGLKDRVSENAVLGAAIYNRWNEMTRHECIWKLEPEISCDFTRCST